jgi:hypothetical protein
MHKVFVLGVPTYFDIQVSSLSICSYAKDTSQLHVSITFNWLVALAYEQIPDDGA